MANELTESVEDLQTRLAELRGIFDLDEKRARLNEIDALSQAPDFWDEPDEAQALMEERGELESLLETVEETDEKLEEAGVFAELAEEAGGDEQAVEDARQLVEEARETVEELELRRMFGGEHDDHDAVFSIQAGAGGTESQDWADMLLRMYTRFFDKMGWDVEVTDRQEGEEAGLKSVDLLVKGDYAYGYLKAEHGVHRLVRISPFDSDNRRHTSFAGVDVAPQIEDDIEIELNDSDLEIDTFRASGAGGQHVNRTESAVRITHQPTGIVVQCQNERSQHANRETARKILRSKLYERERERREEQAQQEHAEKSEVDFGSQIRSYVLHPYQQVKDLRTGLEVGDVDSVLDGEIGQFIEAYLLREHTETGDEE
ncbi:MAG: peptide chain release factor 2 [Bradymonadaceae bacterium]